MKTIMLILTTCLGSAFVLAQDALSDYHCEPSAEHPFGTINPDAPDALADFAPLIGTCQCQSIARIDKETWADTVSMIWTWKYIMDGKAVQDETLKSDGG